MEYRSPWLARPRLLLRPARAGNLHPAHQDLRERCRNIHRTSGSVSRKVPVQMTDVPAQTSTDRGDPVRVLMLTKDWPSPGQPWRAPFIFQQYRFLAAAGADV